MYMTAVLLKDASAGDVSGKTVAPRDGAYSPRSHYFQAIRAAAISISASCLFFLGQLRSWTSEQNRYHYFWSFRDSHALILAVGIVAAVIFIGWVITRIIGSRTIRRISQFIFLVFFTDAVLSGLTSLFVGVGFTAKYDWFFWTTWTVIVLFLVPFFQRLWKPAMALCLVLTPLPWILLFQVLSWRPWNPADRPSSASGRSVRSQQSGLSHLPPIVIFVFDEWSYERTFDGPDVRPEFIHLVDVASRSGVYYKAQSPGSATYFSLPRLLYQRADGELFPHHGQLFWKTSEDRTLVNEQETLFDDLLRAGYQVRVLGFYHPYEILLEERGIQCRSYPNDPKADSVIAQAGLFLLANLRFLTDPLSRVTWRRWDSAFFSQHWFRLSQEFHRETFRLIDQLGPGMCLLIHWPLPHGPFILGPQGQFVEPYSPQQDRTFGTSEQYHRHLLRLDTVIGEICDHLRRKQLFDDALIIMTSDHGWRRDPDPQFREANPDHRHVPLFVKRPQQTVREDFTDPFPLIHLSEVFTQVASNPQ